MPLRWSVSTSRRGFKLLLILTDVPPGVSCFVYLHPGGDDVGGVAEEWQPHIFNVEIVECLPYCSVELVTLINEISTMYVTIVSRTNRCVCDNGVSHVREQTPNITHPPTELFSTSRTSDNVAFSRVKTANKCPDTGACSPQQCEVEYFNFNEHIPPMWSIGTPYSSNAWRNP